MRLGRFQQPTDRADVVFQQRHGHPLDARRRILKQLLRRGHRLARAGSVTAPLLHLSERQMSVDEIVEMSPAPATFDGLIRVVQGRGQVVPRIETPG